MKFALHTSFLPNGDQPRAIESLIAGIENKNQVLLGVTGSGKTFTMANIIATTQKTTLIMAPNKILAAQLYQEMKEFFPKNAVEYFVSYYDYYQPEAYIPSSDTYIAKEATINDAIDRLRHSATRSLMEGEKAVIVSSVSCIYGIGGVASYSAMVLYLVVGEQYPMKELLQQLTELLYKRSQQTLTRGHFKVLGDIIEIFPAHAMDYVWRLEFFGDHLEAISQVEFDGHKSKLTKVAIYPNSHYVTPEPTLRSAISAIRKDLVLRLHELNEAQEYAYATRLESRVEYDLEMIANTGTCQGIENYSRYLSGRAPGEPPPTLFEYLPKDALLIVDESHIAVPQIRGMYVGDAIRKENLSKYGFRLPSCKDNRPLKFSEWDEMRPATIFVSATPGPFEFTLVEKPVEQIIRPTGLLDPICEIRSTLDQIPNLIAEAKKSISLGYRVLITTLTKKMAEGLNDFLEDAQLKSVYMHADVPTLERVEIIQKLRQGVYDILVGINLLREGLDIPECGLMIILDGDKEGYLRSKTSLIQTIGRAARNAESKVIIYADKMTNSLIGALEETKRRRQIQEAYNQKHGITPTTIKKPVHATFSDDMGDLANSEELINILEKEMIAAAEQMDYEKAAKLRDKIKKLRALK